MSNDLHTFLNQQVANHSVLTEKLHHFHYYVPGTTFFTLHKEFRDEFNHSFGLVDDFSERLLMIGGKAITTLKEYLEQTTLLENQKDFKDAPSMVEAIVDDFSQLVSELKHGISLAEQANDPVTEDLFIEIIGYYEDRIWMYRNFLSK
ncbi:DNA starvation/stationary phase protection protein [[Brevibacterium] frigoritolerans]|nr:DNA starvation/stationary phase protection protein [Peribacillus frigoritolerans]